MLQKKQITLTFIYYTVWQCVGFGWLDGWAVQEEIGKLTKFSFLPTLLQLENQNQITDPTKDSAHEEGSHHTGQEKIPATPKLHKLLDAQSSTDRIMKKNIVEPAWTEELCYKVPPWFGKKHQEGSN